MALTKHRKEKCVLLYAEGDKGKQEVAQKLVDADIMAAQYAIAGNGFPGANLENEKNILHEIDIFYSEFLKKIGVEIKKTDIVYTVTDIHGVFRCYLIQKNIKFIHVMLSPMDIYDAYKAIGAFKIGAVSRKYMDVLNAYHVFDATSPYCEKILAFPETTISEKYTVIKRKFEKFDLISEFESFGEEDAEKILNCFHINIKTIQAVKYMILSNSEGYLRSSIDLQGYNGKDRMEHILLYQLLMDYYIDGEAEGFMIKPHPNNYINWEKFFPGMVVLNKNMPVEFIRLCKELHLKKALGLQTTALLRLEDKIDETVLATQAFARYHHSLCQLFAACRLCLKFAEKNTLQQTGFDNDFFVKFLEYAIRDKIAYSDVQQKDTDTFKIFYQPKLNEIRTLFTLLETISTESVLVFMNMPEDVPILSWPSILKENLSIVQIEKNAVKEDCLLLEKPEYLWVFSKSGNLHKQMSTFSETKELIITGVNVKTRVLKKWEKERFLCDYELINETAFYRDMNKILKKYAVERQYLFFNEITDFEEYLSILSILEHVIIIIAVRDNAGKQYSYRTVRIIRELGGKIDWNTLGWNSYIEVINEQTVVHEIRGKYGKPIEYVKMVDGVSVEIHSATYEYGNTAKIIINGNDYAIDERGINIVVYEKRQNKLVDSVCFDTFTDSVRCIRKNKART